MKGIVMKVRCISKLPTDEQAIKLGKYYLVGKQDLHIQVGREYIVFGISILGGEAWIEYVSDYENLLSAPLCLFEITDGRVSKYWSARTNEEGNLILWPPSFYTKFYHDDLFEGVPEIVGDFNKVRSLIEAEAESKLEV